MQVLCVKLVLAVRRSLPPDFGCLVTYSQRLLLDKVIRREVKDKNQYA